ncbi:hypothetical protein TTHERM_00703570 (macronuclear) [Tetrahymena thermophila SB210]|uniref:Uncharacterized protein n=1 Tax=Tetrahymena thermophila (strain SB210) TaxID=312017 RepID=Q22GG6_TETTS|nr:hypothetical protein TTHERM_00703570 [Tetrahymena thermophila SB210]EAR84365.2 hypothetical protein TTHERM_00703570 [Tetrahymena thermophila SB210]|eukprot:XP_001032028.2 hypothetical protein TTHERM_00703570 [Tetrahymena thermophila SB210]
MNSSSLLLTDQSDKNSKSGLESNNSNDTTNNQKKTQSTKFLKKRIQKDEKKQQNQENRVLLAKDIKTKGIQLFINIEFNRTFPMDGDYFVNLDYKKQINIEEQIRIFRGIKQVLFSLKDDKRQLVILDLQTSDNMPFIPQSNIHIAIQKTQDPILLYFSKLIQENNIQMEIQKTLIQRFRIQQNCLENLQEMRRKFFDFKMQQFIQENFTESDFYLYYKYQYRKLDDTSQQYTQVGVSYPLIALIGTDPSSFINICMRNGFLEFSSNYFKQIMIINSMECRLMLHEKQGSVHSRMEEVVLLTLDEYEIHTKMIVTCMKLEFPPELQIEVDGCQLYNEFPVFIQYLIDENALQTLISKRSKNPQFQQQWENEQFGYTLESQIFLEKYYKDFLKETKESKYEHQLKYYYNKECRFKQINICNNHPQDSFENYLKLFSQ